MCLPPIEIRYESEPKTQISERNKTIGESFARFLSREHLFKNPDHHRFVGTSYDADLLDDCCLSIINMLSSLEVCCVTIFFDKCYLQYHFPRCMRKL